MATILQEKYGKKCLDDFHKHHHINLTLGVPLTVKEVKKCLKDHLIKENQLTELNKIAKLIATDEEKESFHLGENVKKPLLPSQGNDYGTFS